LEKQGFEFFNRIVVKPTFRPPAKSLALRHQIDQ